MRQKVKGNFFSVLLPTSVSILNKWKYFITQKNDSVIPRASYICKHRTMYRDKCG